MYKYLQLIISYYTLECLGCTKYLNELTDVISKFVHTHPVHRPHLVPLRRHSQHPFVYVKLRKLRDGASEPEVKIRLDEELAIPIILLNQVGVKTLYSCQGSSASETYIDVEHTPRQMELVKRILPLIFTGREFPLLTYPSVLRLHPCPSALNNFIIGLLSTFEVPVWDVTDCLNTLCE